MNLDMTPNGILLDVKCIAKKEMKKMYKKHKILIRL